MRRMKSALLVLVTLLLAAAGAAMPFAAARLQDARQTGAETWSLDSFSLTLRQETDLGRTLKLIGESDYYFVVSGERLAEARLSEGEALDAAGEVLAELVDRGLLEQLPKEISTPDVWPEILTTEDETTAIPIWSVSWHGSEEYYVWLDDTTGKAFMISAGCPSYTKSYIQNAGREPLYAQAEDWRVFLSDYYGTDVQLAGEEWSDTSVRFALTFPLGEGREQETYGMDLYIYFMDGFATLSPYVSPVSLASAP